MAHHNRTPHSVLAAPSRSYVQLPVEPTMHTDRRGPLPKVRLHAVEPTTYPAGVPHVRDLPPRGFWPKLTDAYGTAGQAAEIRDRADAELKAIEWASVMSEKRRLDRRAAARSRRAAQQRERVAMGTDRATLRARRAAGLP